jgi:hypothetical protein
MSEPSQRLVICVLAGSAPAEDSWVSSMSERIGARPVESSPSSEREGSTASVEQAVLEPARPGVDRLASLGALEQVADVRVRLDELRLAQGFDDEPAIDLLLRDALFRQGRATDFFTGKEREKVRFHLFALLSDQSSAGRFSDLLELVEAIAFHDLPIVVHAILDGVDMPARSAWPLLEELEDKLEKKGVIGTVMGRAWACDKSARWDRTLAAYEAIVRGDVDVMPTAHAALEAAYRDGVDDAFVAPVRIGDYEGLVGELAAELPGGAWEWRGEEVGLLLGLEPDGMHQLAAALTRRALPPEVEGLLALRERPVFAFSPSSLASLVPMATGLELSHVVGDATIPARLLGALSRAERRVVELVDPRVRIAASSGAWRVPAGARVSIELVEPEPRLPQGLSLAGPPPQLPMEVVFEAVQAALARGEPPPPGLVAPEAPEPEACAEEEPSFDPVPAISARGAELLRAAEHDMVLVVLDASGSESAVAELSRVARDLGVELAVVDATQRRGSDSGAVRLWWLSPSDHAPPAATSLPELGRRLLERVGVAT